MLVSVIVPVYNVEKYLERCLNSLIDISLSYEILLVNDGSNDHSQKICEKYIDKYSFIKLINQDNKGLAGARNTGIKYARGKYIVFIDSDDFIDIGSLSFMCQFIEENNVEIGMFDFRYINEDDTTKMNKYLPYECEGVISGQEYLKKALQLDLPMMVWKNIYNTQFLKKNSIFFLEGYNHEDEYWSVIALLMAKRVKSKRFVFYNYFINNQGISKNKERGTKNSLDLMKLCIILKRKINEMKINDSELVELLHRRIITLFLSSAYKSRIYTRKYKNELGTNFFDDLIIKEKKLYLKVLLFRFSQHLYYFVNTAIKGVKK